MKTKKIVIGIYAAVITALSMAAEPFVYVSDYPPGGNADRQIEATFPELKRNGFTPSIEYVKGCKTALNQVRQGQGHFIMFSEKYGLDRECGITVGNNTEFRIVSEVQSVPLMLCSTDKNISLDQLKTGKTFIGMTGPYDDVVGPLLDSVGIDRSKYKTVIYKGTNATLAALKAGDISIGVFGQASSMLATEGKCIVSTDKNALGVPRSRDINPNSKFVEYSTKFVLVSAGIPSKQYVDLFTRVFKSVEWQAYVSKTKFMHNGLGHGISGVETEQQLNSK